MIANTISISGGKDSAAMWVYAIHELKLEGELIPVFADTGNESQLTYDYVDYLEEELGSIKRVKADFSLEIARKREFVQTKWREEGVSEQIIEDALSVLHPTGNPFLDLCIWKGRFPSTMARFCTQFLKSKPLLDEVYVPLLDEGYEVVSLQGIRADESAYRANLSEIEMTPEGIRIYRPILRWNVKDVFAMHDKYGILPNPLYKMGMSRVGCLPCINGRKGEIYEMAKRFPEEVDRLRNWEEIVGKASKRGSSSFFKHDDVAGKGIDDWVSWSRTTNGGKMYDMFKLQENDEPELCSSKYGLCE